MYYPKQIPYLLNENFKSNIDYVEYCDESFENYCLCIWQMKSKGQIKDTLYNYILPDACIDLIIDFIKEEIYFAGFSKNTKILEFVNDVDYMGIRFKPGAFCSLFEIPSSAVMDDMVSFSKVENNNLNDIFNCKVSDRLDVLKHFLIDKISNKSEDFFITLVDKLYETPKEQSVFDIAKQFNYDKRQLFRIFMKHYGVSPKVLLNILRLHLCLTLLFDDKKSLSNISNVCGFYDQSHFIKEVKKYTGISPIKLLDIYKK